MAFRKYKDIGEVIATHELMYQENDFIKTEPNVAVPQELANEIQFVINNFSYNVSEAAICEMIIFPILKTIWKEYKQDLMLWSHRSIEFSKDLKGIPDYTIARQSKRGKVVFELPLLAVVEAKKDDFDGGWAQCALEMFTIQCINKRIDLPIYGIVTNGDVWSFGMLSGTIFTKDTHSLLLTNLGAICTALHQILRSCSANAQLN